MRDQEKFENIDIGYDVNVINRDMTPIAFPLHWHRYIEILAVPEDEVLEAELEVIINDTHYFLKPGDMCFVWPGQLHEIVQNQNKKLIGMQFIPELFREFSDFDPYRNQLHHVQKLSYEQQTELLQVLHMHLQSMITLQEQQTRFYHIEKIMHLFDFFMELINAMIDSMENEIMYDIDQREDVAWKIQNSCNYIMNHSAEDISLTDIAEYAGFSPSYFSRVFKQITGSNFVEYLLHERVKRAQILLANSGMSITDVSYSAGFKSISTFNRVFRQFSGCSPTEYRKYRLE